MAAQTFDDLAGRAQSALQNQPAEAAELYRQALVLKPDWAEGWFYRAASLFETGRFAEARPAFEKSAALAPQNGTVWAFLGLCDYHLGEYNAALANILKGETLGIGNDKPFLSAVRNHAALIYLRSGAFGSAVSQLQPLARIGDDSAHTIENLGVSALGIAHSPAEVGAARKPLVELAGRAIWALTAQDPARSRELFSELIAKYPNEPGVHYLNALYLATSDPEKAMAECERELALNPSQVPAHIVLANLRIKAGAPGEAEKMASAAVKLEPANAFAHAELGRALLALGRTDSALLHLQRATQLAPENPQMHFYLAQVLHRAGKLAEAEQEEALFARLKASADPLVVKDADGLLMADPKTPSGPR